MRFPRSSGILLHPTSLPGPYGIGELGLPAHRFADFLRDAGQRIWQVLPLGPTGYGDSPYQCFSAFAGNPLLISLETLVERGYLDARDSWNARPEFPADTRRFRRGHRVENSLVAQGISSVSETRAAEREAFDGVLRNIPRWLDEFALFMA